jgi:hypothetical protein
MKLNEIYCLSKTQINFSQPDSCSNFNALGYLFGFNERINLMKENIVAKLKPILLLS